MPDTHEIVINLHMHTRYSDGHGNHDDIGQAALKAGIDAAIVTDHNVWVSGPEDYYRDGDQRALLMVGEEIHDQARDPQKNHLLVFGAGRELAALAYDSQRLIDAVNAAGGLSFLAHIIDPESPAANETDISWEDWDVQGFTGIELWNGLSEFKGLIKTKAHALAYAYMPHRIARGPYPEAIQRWDLLLKQGKKVVAIGGSDAHRIPARLGPLKKTLFPYEWHFRGINTHLLLPQPLNGEASRDGRLILDALRQGHAFIGYDLPASTRGFNFTAHGLDKTAWMGDEIGDKEHPGAQKGITFQIRLPRRAECNLLKDGKIIKTWNHRDTCTYITTEPGVYRVEVYIQYYGRRAWIFSNPIYVR